MLQVSVTVSRVFYPREDAVPNGKTFFCVFNSREHGKCAGVIPFYPSVGAKLNLIGDWETRNGEREFKFTRVTQDVPRDPRTLLEYTVSLTNGLGPKAVESIWNEYGADWQNHIGDMKPAHGLKLARTLDALGANKALLDLTLLFVRLGLSPNIAKKAFNLWGDGAAAVFRNNPYSLTKVDGVGFKTCDTDEIRKEFGISPRDLRRAVSAVDFSVNSAMDASGDSIVSRDSLYANLRDLRIDRDVAAVAISNLVSSGRIVFVDLDKVTTSEVIEAEGEIGRYIADNTANDGDGIAALWPDGFTPDESQASAVRSVLSWRGLRVVNGGAGVGKSTIIRTITNSLEAAGETVLLCAFAGKAAARMREATGHAASTIHSMLGWRGDGVRFSLGNLYGRTVIVDESSMVPSWLLAEIAKRNPHRLVLVGDQAQLQPVGIGSPFHDIIDTLPALVDTLTKCYRNREAVFASALKIRGGKIPTSCRSSAERFEIVHVAGPEAAHDLILGKVSDGTVDFSQDLVLCPRNGEGEEPAPCTVKSVNASIQNIVNPHDAGEKFKVGDRVMCVKNFAANDVWNGTVGFIQSVDARGVARFVSDDGADMRLDDKEKKDSIVPAYCLTIHKSQGSQYRDVYIVCLRRDMAVLMDRSMLYTAVTRARRACYVITDDGIDRVVASTSRRNTYLKSILNG